MPTFATRRPSEIRSITRKIVLYAILAILSAWTVGSGYYIAYHDRLLASLLSRQAQARYANESRIATMQDALDAAGDRSARIDEAQLARWRELEARTASLEVRASELEVLLVGGLQPGERRPRAATSTELRRAELDPATSTASAVAALEAKERRAVHGALDRTLRSAGRLQAALAALGLAAPEHGGGASTGGPFVPLPDGAATIDVDIAELKSALARQERFAAATAHLPLRQPFAGRLDVTSGYGARRDPFLGRLALHTGIDLRNDYGSAVHAAAGGIVTIAGDESGYGTTVEIDHGNGYATRYAHLSSVAVVVGQSIAAGASVGAVGTSGRSTGPHLHYEIRIAGEPIDPARYLALAATIAGP